MMRVFVLLGLATGERVSGSTGPPSHATDSTTVAASATKVLELGFERREEDDFTDRR